MPKIIDPNIPRKSLIVDASLASDPRSFPLPSVVEISESGTCNRKCVFCPRSDPDFPDVKEFISPALVEKLSKQVAAVGFHGIFLFSGFVEPLLDKKIYELIAIAHKNLPNARVELVTNGDALDKKRIKKLFESGLSTLLISAYDGADQAQEFEELCVASGLKENQFIIRHRYLPPEGDFGIKLSNRAGMMETAEFAIDTPQVALQAPCYYPHYTFFMDYLGDVLLCPHDWGKKRVLGNLNNQNFSEIWFGKEYAFVRKKLSGGNRDFNPCKDCDVHGTLMGDKHAEAWMTLYEEEEQSD